MTRICRVISDFRVVADFEVRRPGWKESAACPTRARNCNHPKQSRRLEDDARCFPRFLRVAGRAKRSDPSLTSTFYLHLGKSAMVDRSPACGRTFSSSPPVPNCGICGKPESTHICRSSKNSPVSCRETKKRLKFNHIRWRLTLPRDTRFTDHPERRRSPNRWHLRSGGSFSGRMPTHFSVFATDSWSMEGRE